VSVVLAEWRDPIFDEKFEEIPAALAARLADMAAELTAGEDVATALDQWRHVRRSPGLLPKGMRIYYERLGTLLALAWTARRVNAATFDGREPPSQVEKAVGRVIAQSFHQGCSLADVALASGLDPEQVIAIGKRTIRRTKWLDRL
jgi:hypothetical protein